MKTCTKNYFTALLFIFLASPVLAQLPLMGPIQGPSAVCSMPAAPKTFTASASNSPTSYNWSVLGAPGVIIGSPSSAITSISFPFPYVNATYTIYCSATNGTGTSPTTSFVVSVFETPTVTFSGNFTFCQGSSTMLSASPTVLSGSSTMTYSWTPATGLSSTSTRTTIASPNTTTTYTLLLGLGACNNSAQVTIQIQICTGFVNYFKEENSYSLNVYPNPNNGSFVLKTPKVQTATIINELGQTIRKFDLMPDTEIRVEGLKPGVYFVVTPTSKHKIIVGD